MAKLSLNQAWNETAAFVKREGRLLFPIALLLVVLPTIVVRLLMPQDTPPGQLPEAGAWLAVLPIAILIGMVGNIAIATLALRSGITVGEALGNGLRRMPALLGASLLVGIGLCVVVFVVAVILALVVVGATPNPPPQEVLTAGVIGAILLFPILLYVGARMLATTPVAAAERGGPIAILGRSWRLTGGSVWTLVGFLLLLIVLVIVIGMAVVAVFGILATLIGGPIRPGSLSMILMLLVDAVFNMVLTVYVTVMIARIYAQLAGNGSAEAAA
jgi:hypothetical protein